MRGAEGQVRETELVGGARGVEGGRPCRGLRRRVEAGDEGVARRRGGQHVAVAEVERAAERTVEGESAVADSSRSEKYSFATDHRSGAPTRCCRACRARRATRPSPMPVSRDDVAVRLAAGDPEVAGAVERSGARAPVVVELARPDAAAGRVEDGGVSDSLRSCVDGRAAGQRHRRLLKAPTMPM